MTKIDELDEEIVTMTTKELDTISFKDSKLAENDIINRPVHYQSETGLETIDVIEAFTFGLKGIEATDTGNIIKYACRWSKKNGIQDLEKLVWYAQHLIEHLKKKEQYENE